MVTPEVPLIAMLYLPRPWAAVTYTGRKGDHNPSPKLAHYIPRALRTTIDDLLHFE